MTRLCCYLYFVEDLNKRAILNSNESINASRGNNIYNNNNYNSKQDKKKEKIIILKDFGKGIYWKANFANNLGEV